MGAKQMSCDQKVVFDFYGIYHYIIITIIIIITIT